MALEYKESEYDLVYVKIPCMVEGCERETQVQIPKNTGVPKGLRKRCAYCNKSLGVAGSDTIGYAKHNPGNKRA